MGILPTPSDKAAYLKAQANKAKRQAARASQADNPAEAERLNEIAKKAETAAVMAKQQAEKANG